MSNHEEENNNAGAQSHTECANLTDVFAAVVAPGTGDNEMTTPIAQGSVDVNVSRHDCYAEDGDPVKCWKCGCNEQREEVRSMVDVLHGQGPVCEYEVFCAKCGTGIGYWAYGSFDHGYMRDLVTANDSR